MDPTLTGEVQAAAERLRQAGTLRRPCGSLRDLVGDDVETALAVQRHVLALQTIGGAVRVGAKVGRPRPGGLRSTGVLLAEMRLADHARVATSRLLQPRVELKLACTVVTDLGPDPGRLAPDELRARTAVCVALEVTDCRIAGRVLSLADEICDNAGAGLFVLGAHRVPAVDLGPDARAARLEVDTELTWRGSVSVDAALADLRSVAVAAAHRDEPLGVGELVLATAVGPTLPATEGQHHAAYVEGLGPATIGFTTSSRLATTEGNP